MDNRYRPEIDGLRAISVLAVIFWHAEFKIFPGGFIGVDVFFVISGYLITQLIVRDLQEGTFSFLRFYERRARRILPALFLVILCCIPFALAWMMPAELNAYSKSVVSAVLGASNFLFWKQSGYFDQYAELKPLLHTWSLGLEEQFYLVFPMGLVLLWRLGRRNVIWSIAVAAVLSFAFCEYARRVYPFANFYFLPSRAWELLAGALCSFARPGIHIRRDNVLAASGLAALVVAGVFYDKTLPLPSFYTLLPVLGTCALLVFGHRTTLVGWVLSAKPLVGIGLVSYSAYLWHQPMFAFARIRLLNEPDWMILSCLIVTSFVLSYFSWKFVEVPARRASWRLTDRRMVFSILALTGAVLVTAGIVGQYAKVELSRIHPGIIELEKRISTNIGLSNVCNIDFKLSPKCRTSEAPEVILWGDSFAMHLMEGLRASNPDISIVQMTKSVCGPFIGIAPIVNPKYPVSWAKECLHFNDQVMDFIKQTKSLKYAVLSSPFVHFVNPDKSLLTREHEIIVDKKVSLAAFRQTLELLVSFGIKPIIFSPPPRPGFNAGYCVVKAERYQESTDLCNFSHKKSMVHQKYVRELLTDIARDYKVVWLDTAICEGDICTASQEGQFIYNDFWHLSREGSAFIGRKMNFYGLITGN